LYSLLIALGSLTANAQLANPDFEDWYQVFGVDRLDVWEHLAKGDQPTSTFPGTWKSTDSHHGDFALMLSRWYNYTWDVVRQKAPINTKPDFLNGYYHYTLTNLVGAVTHDTALVQVYLTRWNGSTMTQDTIGKAVKELGHAGSYTAFSCAIDYLMFGQPDSILIHIQPSKFEGIGTSCVDSNYCSFLVIDDLSLSTASSVPNTRYTGIRLYPNPVQNQLNIWNGDGHITEVRVTDLTGKLLASIAGADARVSINAEKWAPGIYLVHLRDRSQQWHIEKIVRE
jgi:hypothetical protein